MYFSFIKLTEVPVIDNVVRVSSPFTFIIQRFLFAGERFEVMTEPWSGFSGINKFGWDVQVT